jgi:hypothetical protein
MPSNRLNSSQIAGSSSGELGSSERLNTPETPAGLQEYRLNTDIREHLETMWEGLLYLSEQEFDEAIVGVADRIGMDAVVVYDTTKIIDILCEHHGMDREEATEYYEFNIAGAYVGNRTPMFIAMIDDLIW